MRSVVLSLAAAGAALAVASPAAAQYYPTQPYGYGYNGYGNRCSSPAAGAASESARELKCRQVNRKR